MSTIDNPPRLDIADDAWVENGDEVPHTCLLTTIVVNGLYMHLEAWEVRVDDDGIQSAVGVEYGDSFALLHEAVSGDGHFDTVTIRGREYILVATPFC